MLSSPQGLRDRGRALLLGLCALAAASSSIRADELAYTACAEATAYSEKLGKAERKRREEEAKQEALDNLALHVWVAAFGSAPAVSPRRRDDDATVQDTDKRFASLRSRYQVNRRIADGKFTLVGNKHRKEVFYCLTDGSFRAAVNGLREQREQTIEVLRIRFAELEELIAAGELEEASRKLTGLAVEVVNEAVDQATYDARLEDRSRSFYAWLLEWGDVVPKGREYVEYLNERAAELLELGYLEEADRYLFEALAADRESEVARQLRAATQQRRREQVELLAEAEELAEDGRFRAADERIKQAEVMSRDDPFLIEQTRKTVAGMEAAFRQYNPSARGLIYTTFGTLGMDTSQTDQQIRSSTGIPVESGALLSLGGGGNFLLRRKLLLSFAGSWGVSQDQNLFLGNAPLELYSMFQLSVGAGYRTLRSERRKWAISVIGGPVWEAVEANSALEDNSALDTGLDESDHQIAFFARIAAEWKTISVYVGHGIGFRENPESVIVWSNQLQFGFGFGF